jgi:dTDP-glucose 4,6-dehydratase
MNLVVTGGAGFIGSNYVKRALKSNLLKIEKIVVVDNLTYAGSQENLADVMDDPRFTFIKGDICDQGLIEKVLTGMDQIIHFAAESHVDRSIDSSDAFVRTNVLGTAVLLEALRKNQRIKFLHVSTDEVYGSIENGSWTESSPLIPNSPYSASKAASDLLALSYHRTYGLDIRISRCCNNYGPNQFPEKIIPLFITNLIAGKKLPLYGTGLNKREWIHVDDHCAALDLLLLNGKAGEVYNIGGGEELTNLDLTRMILDAFNKSTDEIEYVADRLGHDLRYSLNSTKAKNALGFIPQINFKKGLLETIDWYLEHEEWWRSKINA